MGALIEPTVPRSDGKAYYRARGLFSQKIVDCVTQRRADGRSHDPEKDARRDDMLKIAGYPVAHWKSKGKPDVQAIRDALLPTSPAPEVKAQARPAVS